MKINSKKSLIIFSCLASAVLIFVIYNNYQNKTSFHSKKERIIKNTKQDRVTQKVNQTKNSQFKKDFDKVLQISESELYLGKKNAPITIVEYASLSCPHCAAFYQKAFDQLNEDFIKTGKVRFVYRDFPLNQPALAGALIAVCRAQIEEENRAQNYYNFVKALYKNQDSWAFDPSFVNKLESIALLDGISSEKFNSCIEDKDLQEKILKARLIASQSLNIRSTPTFFINQKLIEGFIDYKTLKKEIIKELNNI